MDPETQTILHEAWRETPKRVQDAIFAHNHRDVVQKAAKNFTMDTEGLASLEQEVLFVLLGLQTVPEFEDEISLRSVLTTEQSRSFIKYIREELFAGLIPLSRETIPQEGGRIVADAAHGTAVTIHTAIDAYGLVRERLERLPQTVQETIRSQQLEDSLASLLQKHALGEGLTPVFVAEAVRVMVGLTTTNNFKTEVTRAAHWDPNRLDSLFLDSESLLFKPVRLSIMRALEQRQMVSDSTDQGGAVVPRPPSTNVPVSQNQDPYRESV